MSFSKQKPAGRAAISKPYSWHWIGVLICVLTTAGSHAAQKSTNWLPEPEVAKQLRFEGVTQEEERGTSFQRFRFFSAGDAQRCRIEATVPEMLPIEEFEAVARVNSTHAGIQLLVRLVLPNQLDPKTGRPLVTWLRGVRSQSPSEWEELNVSLTDAAITEQLVRVRTALDPVRINADGMYIDRLGIQAEFGPGECVVDLQSVTYGPIVLRPDSASDVNAEPAVAGPVENRLRVERNQVFLKDRPFFVRLMPYHGEPHESLDTLRVNTLWVDDYRSSERTQVLADEGYVIAAIPPHPQFDPRDFSQPIVGLGPLDQDSSVTDIWILGTRVPSTEWPHVRAWAREVRSADRLRGRPLMVDVTGAESLVSRLFDVVGVGPPSLHRNLTLGQFRNRILLSSQQASQLTLPFCWVQTESPNSLTKWRAQLGLPPLVVEPEQITMQVMAALSAGSRAIAFWKTKPFGQGKLSESETGLAVALSNLHIDLFESWLVQGQAQSYIAVNSQPVRRGQPHGQNQFLQNAVGSPLVSVNPLERKIPLGPDATVISGRAGSLILPVMWDAATQFVPGSLYTPEARLTVRARETASASQITATGVRGIRRVETAGGLAVKIQDLDQFAAVLVASEPSAFSAMAERVDYAAPRAAELRCWIARLKHPRVVQTCEQINQLAPSIPPSASKSLENAGLWLQNAETALNDGRFAEASRNAEHCLRVLRHVQNLYWKDAIRQLPTPTASPFTIAFSGLPEHWRMMQVVQSATPSANLIPSGPFRRLQELEEHGWQFPRHEKNAYLTDTDVRVDSGGNSRYLQFAASRRQNVRTVTPDLPSIMISAPSVPVNAGDFVVIRGRARIGTRVKAEEEYPLMILDSDLGPEFAVRPALETSWRSFHMYRQASASGLLQVSFALKGGADLHLDLDGFSVQKVGRLEWESGEKSQLQLQPISRSRVQGAGHSFPSLDWESPFR